VLTYGTDETLETISSQISNKNKTQFIGKGDIKNSLVVDVNLFSPKEISTLCALWNGRGCLTPVALFCQGNKENSLKWTKEFANYYENEFKQRLAPYDSGFIKHFTHAHNAATVCGQLKQMGLDSSVCTIKGEYTCVVNLTLCPQEKFLQFAPELSFGGAGFIYLFPISFKEKLMHTLKELPVLPSIHEWL
jgi:hypothetical protein